MSIENNDFENSDDIPQETIHGGDGEFKLPSLNELLDAIDHFDGMSDEDREQLKESLLESQADGQKDPFKNAVPKIGEAVVWNLELLMFLLFFSVIISIFGKVLLHISFI